MEHGLTTNERLTAAKIRRLHYVCINRIVQRGGHCWTDYRFARFFHNVVPLFEEVVLLGVEAETVLQPFDLTEGFSNLTAQALPAPTGRFQRAAHQLPYLWRALKEAELVCIDLPSEIGFLAAVVCRIKRVPFLVQILGDWREAILSNGPPTLRRRVKAAAADWMARWTVRNARLVFAQGSELFKKLARVNPQALQSDCVRSTLSLDDFYERPITPFHDPLRLLTVSHLLPLKGLATLVEAMQILAARGRRIEYWCAGEGPSREPLDDLAQRLGLSASVRFLGHVPHGSELFELYRKTDLFILPSFTEGLPNALLEAMAHSLPIVASRVGGVPEAVRDGIEAVLVDPGNPQQLAEAIAFLAGNPERAREMGRNAFERAKRFTAESLARENLRLIERTFGEIHHHPASIPEEEAFGPRPLPIADHASSE